jgi:ubiquinone/menaquinone biosynthesis C-methylase UbiE
MTAAIRRFVQFVRPTFLKFIPQVDLYGYSPYRGFADSYCLPQNSDDFDGVCSQGLPVPPEWLRFGYRTSEAYLQTGKTDIDAMLDLCPLDDAQRILDFGCGSGRMIRWLKDEAVAREIWGTDIIADYLLWCQQHLSPPFHFVLATILPHLPFEDRHFDLIYAGSVFTHLDDLASAWLLELRRVLSDDGKLYITLHDENTIKLLDNEYKNHASARSFKAKKAYGEYSRGDFGMFSLGRRTGSQVFYNMAYFRRMAEQLKLEVVLVEPGAYRYQTGVVLKRVN